jgi:hypothetical protein
MPKDAIFSIASMTNLGIFSSIVPTTFDDEAAAPVPREAVPAQGCDHLSVLPAGG